MLSCSFAGAAFGAEGQLSYIEAEKDGIGGVDGLEGASGVSTSPDGKHVYAASVTDKAVAVFVRDPASGALSFVEAEKDGIGGVDGLDGARGVSVSPDGKHVYVASQTEHAVAVFVRDPASGALSFVEAEKDGIGGVDGLEGATGVGVTADGKHVYVASFADDAVAVFARNPASGALSYVEAERDGIGGVDGLDGARFTYSSPDGKHVYVTGQIDGAVAVFARNPGSGALSFVEAAIDGVGGVDGISGAWGVTGTADGRHIYVGGWWENAVAAFARDPTSGALSFVEAERNGVGGVTGLLGSVGVDDSPDGKHIYVAGSASNAVAVFARNPASGALSFLERKQDGVGGVDGLFWAFDIDVAPDGKHVYAAAQLDNAVAAFARAADVTAPETSIDSGPTGYTSDPSPSFGFSSSDPAFTARFECRVDGGAFDACTSPTTIGPLSLGPHSFEVRAIDTAANADPSAAFRTFAVVDSEVTDPDVRAKKTQRQSGKRIKLKLKAGAGEPVDILVEGEIVARSKGKGRLTPRPGKGFKLQRARASADAGERAALTLKPANKGDGGKISKLLRDGAKLSAELAVKLTDDAGNSVVKQVKVKLKAK